MNHHIAKMTESKRAMRKKLAALSIPEKLALLDAMRARAIALQTARAQQKPSATNEAEIE